MTTLAMRLWPRPWAQCAPRAHPSCVRACGALPPVCAQSHPNPNLFPPELLSSKNQIRECALPEVRDRWLRLLLSCIGLHAQL